MQVSIGVRGHSRGHQRHQVCHRGRCALQRKPVDNPLVDVRVERGLRLDEVGAFLCYRYSGHFRTDFEVDLKSRGYSRAHVHILGEGSEPGRCHHCVIRIERHIRELEGAIGRRHRFAMKTADRVRNFYLGVPDAPSRRIRDHTFNRTGIPDLRHS